MLVGCLTSLVMEVTTRHILAKMRTNCRDCTAELDGYSPTYCKKCVTRHQREWRGLNPEKASSIGYRAHRGTREEAIAQYGYVCVCCGEGGYDFMSLDHIIPGSEPRLTGYKLIRWLKERGWPKDNIQLLCHNCNLGKRSRVGCPHNALMLDRPYQI